MNVGQNLAFVELSSSWCRTTTGPQSYLPSACIHLHQAPVDQSPANCKSAAADETDMFPRMVHGHVRHETVPALRRGSTCTFSLYRQSLCRISAAFSAMAPICCIDASRSRPSLVSATITFRWLWCTTRRKEHALCFATIVGHAVLPSIRICLLPIRRQLQKSDRSWPTNQCPHKRSLR